MKRLVLDTNLLVLLIVGNLDRSRIGARRLEAFEPHHLDLLNEIVVRFPVHASTPNVLTEASNHIGSGRQQLAKGACAALAEYIDFLDEIYVPSRETLMESFFLSLGLADAGLAVLAGRGDHVITADGPMYGKLVGHGIRVRNFWHEAQVG